MRNIFRYKTKSVITLAVSVALSIFLLLFACNLTSSQQRLDGLDEEMPVDLYVTSVSGNKNKNLTIDTDIIDKINTTGMVEPIRYTGRMLYLSQKYIDEMLTPYGIPVESSVNPSNSHMVLFHSDDALLKEQNGADEIKYMEGYDSSMFGLDEDIVLIKKSLFEELGIKLGEEYDIRLFNLQYRGVASGRMSGGMDYFKIYSAGEKRIKVVGTYETYEDAAEAKRAEIDMFMPYASMYRYAEEARVNPWPTMAWFRVKEPRQLNLLKEKLAELEIPQADKKKTSSGVFGTTVALTDSVYIGTAEPLQRNLSLMKTVYPLVLVGVVLISFLASYLLMQSRKKELAIMRSLGISKKGVYVRLICESMVLALLGVVIGCCLVLLMGVGELGEVLLPAGLYVLAYFLGTSAAIIITDSNDVLSILASAD